MSIEDEIKKMKDEIEKDSNIFLKIAIFGQPGAGKSTLLNKLINKKVSDTGEGTDKTQKENTYGWRGLEIVDLPGYDTEKFPKETYFERFDILSYDLFLCVFSGKFHQADSEFFQRLKSEGKICLFIRNKHDTIWNEEKGIDELMKEIEEDTHKQVKSNEKVYFTSCRTNYGLEQLSNAMFANLNQVKRQKFVESAKAYSISFLEEKKKICDKKVSLFAGLAAANGLNPVPGLDVGLDISVLMSLFKQIRDIYGLSDEIIKNKIFIIPAIAQAANNVIKYATNDGIIILIKKVAQKSFAKQFAKYAPIVGQVIAASIGFGITFQAGKSYLDDCHEVAKGILESELRYK